MKAPTKQRKDDLAIGRLAVNNRDTAGKDPSAAILSSSNGYRDTREPM
jgi:hypothetical protein